MIKKEWYDKSLKEIFSGNHKKIYLILALIGVILFVVRLLFVFNSVKYETCIFLSTQTLILLGCFVGVILGTKD